VLRSGKQDSDRGVAVAPRAAELLKVVLERLRMLPVNNEPDVRQIESHTEGIGADDDVGGRVDTAREPAEQIVAVVSGTELRMEKGHLQPKQPQTEIGRASCRERVDIAEEGA